MFTILLSAGMGNYFYTFFTFSYLADHYGQDVEIIIGYSHHQSIYTNIIDELDTYNISKRILFEYSSDGYITSIYDDVSINKIKEWYLPDRCICISDKHLEYDKVGELRLKDEAVLDKYDVFLCYFEHFYDSARDVWLKGKNEYICSFFSTYTKKVLFQSFAQEAKNIIAFHIRYYKLVRQFSERSVNKLLKELIVFLRKTFPMMRILIFTDSVEKVDKVINNTYGVLYINLDGESPLKDLDELICFSLCKYRLSFDCSSFPRWGMILSKGDLDNSFYFQTHIIRSSNRSFWGLLKKYRIFGPYLYYCRKFENKDEFSKWIHRIKNEGEMLNVVENEEKIYQLLNNKGNDSTFSVKRKSNINIYVFVKINLESFTAVTDYLEDIGIELASLNYSVSFVVDPIKTDRDKSMNSIDYIRMVQQYSECRYIDFESFEDEINNNNENRKLLLYKCYDNVTLENYKNCIRVGFYKVKWYDEHYYDNDKEVHFEDNDYIVTCESHKSKFVDYENVKIVKDVKTFTEYKKKLHVVDLQKKDEWTEDIVNYVNNIIDNLDKSSRKCDIIDKDL